jgi:hypothetical protein
MAGSNRGDHVCERFGGIISPDVEDDKLIARGRTQSRSDDGRPLAPFGGHVRHPFGGLAVAEAFRRSSQRPCIARVPRDDHLYGFKMAVCPQKVAVCRHGPGRK